MLFEPSHGDKKLFSANVFSYADRKNLCEHAYQYTLAGLRYRANELEPILARHSVSRNHQILTNESSLSSNGNSPHLGKHRAQSKHDAKINQIYDTLSTLEQWLDAQA